MIDPLLTIVIPAYNEESRLPATLTRVSEALELRGEPYEVLVVVNRDAHALTLIPVNAPTTQTVVPLGSASPVPAGLTALEGIALVPLGDDDAVAVVDLAAQGARQLDGLHLAAEGLGERGVHDALHTVLEPVEDAHAHHLPHRTRLPSVTGRRPTFCLNRSHADRDRAVPAGERRAGTW